MKELKRQLVQDYIIEGKGKEITLPFIQREKSGSIINDATAFFKEIGLNVTVTNVILDDLWGYLAVCELPFPHHSLGKRKKLELSLSRIEELKQGTLSLFKQALENEQLMFRYGSHLDAIARSKELEKLSLEKGNYYINFLTPQREIRIIPPKETVVINLADNDYFKEVMQQLKENKVIGILHI